ncbi:hypothetical protein CLOM_g5205, partial [Closterium sp. NIES-68]
LQHQASHAECEAEAWWVTRSSPTTPSPARPCGGGSCQNHDYHHHPNLHHSDHRHHRNHHHTVVSLHRNSENHDWDHDHHHESRQHSHLRELHDTVSEDDGRSQGQRFPNPPSLCRLNSDTAALIHQCCGPRLPASSSEPSRQLQPFWSLPCIRPATALQPTRSKGHVTLAEVQTAVSPVSLHSVRNSGRLLLFQSNQQSGSGEQRARRARRTSSLGSNALEAAAVRSCAENGCSDDRHGVQMSPCSLGAPPSVAGRIASSNGHSKNCSQNRFTLGPDSPGSGVYAHSRAHGSGDSSDSCGFALSDISSDVSNDSSSDMNSEHGSYPAGKQIEGYDGHLMGAGGKVDSASFGK